MTSLVGITPLKFSSACKVFWDPEVSKESVAESCLFLVLLQYFLLEPFASMELERMLGTN